MSVRHDLRLRQSQRLILRSELKENLEILQFSAQELSAYVEKELMENPLVELEEETASSRDSWSEGNEAERNEAGEGRGEVADWIEYFCDASDLGYAPGGAEPANFSPEFSPAGPTLYESLLAQLGMLRLSPRERLIGEYIIGNISPTGYLSLSVAELSAALGVAPDETERMVRLVQSFDPPGVGARDLKECLRLQAERRGLGALSRMLIEEHLEALAAGEVSRVARLVGVSTGEILAAAAEIRSLNPKPGSIFAGGPVPYVVPDLIIERVGDEYVVLLNDSAGPRLRLSQTYREFLNRKDLSGEARSFLLSRLKRALTLVKAIEKRGATLYRIGVALVQLQRGFFDEGLVALRSLTLKDLAEAVGLHESTVSRAIANKYLQCPRGVFKLRFFVSSGVGAADGGKVSAHSVKELIKQLVGEEPRGQPLSDKDIAARLSRQGINISRRTVAKYRSELGIPGSAARRNRVR